MKIPFSGHFSYICCIDKFLLQQQERGQTFGLVESIKFLMAEFENVRLDTLEYHDTHTISRGTGIVQVLVMCDEVFCVSDLATGKVYQGYNDGKVRSVPHVVRLEVDMSYTISETVSFDEMGSFRIVDWDDLLEGNIWYL
mmetsp:Transcript_22833/g.32690  ORF Transcript_22833/g.32690 Transcript_22833/m.32690 type:complete len:140 (-) Transcript_22833:131-550(-)